MDISAILTEYGAFYRQQGQNMASLYQVAKRPFVSEAAFTPIVTDQTIWQAAKTSYQRLVQPFQSKFTPISGVKFEPLEIRMYQLKADTQEDPSQLEATWLGFLASDNLKRSEWPFIRWMLEVHFYPQIKQDLEMLEIAKGVYAAPADGVAGAAGTSMNGILTIMKTLITAGKITPFAMGVIPTDAADFVTYIETMADMIRTDFWDFPMEFNMSQTLERLYMRGKREKYGKNFVGNDLTNSVEYTNLTVRGLPSHNGSSRIWCTPKGNAIELKKKTQNESLVDIQAFDRLVKIMTDWWMGVGFILAELVFCNDQQ